jgi:hypothetical protein
MAGIERRLAGRSGNGWAIAWGFAGQAAMLVGIAAAAGLSHAAHTATAVSVAAPAPAAWGPNLKGPAFYGSAGVIPVVVATDGQAGKDAFPSASMADFAVAPGADLTFTVTMDIPAGADVSDASVMAAPASLDPSDGDGSLSILTSQPLTAGAVNVFTVWWQGSAQDLTPGSQWTLFMATDGPGMSAQAPIAEITVTS